MKTIYKADVSAKPWSGGTSTELAIFPEGAEYAARDFIWRLSTAEVRDEESTFTALPDYHRMLMIRKGLLSLSHDGGEWYDLPEGQVTEFDGGSLTRSRGQVTDFNLMLRKGAAIGRLAAADTSWEQGRIFLDQIFPDWKQPEEREIRGIFVSEGGGVSLHGSIADYLLPGEMILFAKEDDAEDIMIQEESAGRIIEIVIRMV